jgi:hypothetical protein
MSDEADKATPEGQADTFIKHISTPGKLSKPTLVRIKTVTDRALQDIAVDGIGHINGDHRG